MHFLRVTLNSYEVLSSFWASKHARISCKNIHRPTSLFLTRWNIKLTSGYHLLCLGNRVTQWGSKSPQATPSNWFSLTFASFSLTLFFFDGFDFQSCFFNVGCPFWIHWVGHPVSASCSSLMHFYSLFEFNNEQINYTLIKYNLRGKGRCIFNYGRHNFLQMGGLLGQNTFLLVPIFNSFSTFVNSSCFLHSRKNHQDGNYVLWKDDPFQYCKLKLEFFFTKH